MSCTIPTTTPLAWTAPDGPVNALAMGAEGLWVGGKFHTIGGATRHGIAVLDPATGLATAWESGAGCPGNNVTAMALDSSRVYLSGNFEAGHTSPATWNDARNFFIALDRATGAVDSFDLNPSAGRPGLAKSARAIAVAADAIYFGGDYLLDDTNGSFAIVAFDLSTGLPLAGFDPKTRDEGGVSQSVQTRGGQCFALAIDGSNLYAAYRDIPAASVLGIDRHTGVVLTGFDSWVDSNYVAFSGLVESLLVDSANGLLWVGGDFARAFIGSLPTGGRPHQDTSRLAALSLSDGSLTGWASAAPAATPVRDDADTSVRSLALDSAAGRLYYGSNADAGVSDATPGAVVGAVDTATGSIVWGPTVTRGTPAPRWRAGACAFDATTCRVFLGGTFTVVGGTPSPYLVAFSP